ncbi:MAG TPA: hypothetical protein ENI17_13640 [Pseudomonas xinjiangensis]|uniref:ABC-type transport auxiliary lipoprotein component domain-containing protein n=2 Tax=root TaxID=1 RepID=A0A7V1BP67_9GAMM|nr:hypothetical protein [Halopseudomonas xinjiangensis]HEC48650.1 hypothetical protein [Halopseudomonas xinjiangensis]
MNISTGLIRTALLTAGLVWLSACTILPESEPLKVYQFPSPMMQAAQNSDAMTVSLRVNTPQTGFALNSARMLVNPEGNELSTYKGARWADPSPALMREHIAKSFALHGSIETITTDEHALHADVHLGSDLRRFQVTYQDGQPRAVIELDARLIDANTRRVLAHRTFRVEQPLENEQVPGVVDAFGQAADHLAEQLVPWTLNNLRLHSRAISE